MKDIIGSLLNIIDHAVRFISPKKGERRNFGIEKQTSWSFFWGTSSNADNCSCVTPNSKDKNKEK